MNRRETMVNNNMLCTIPNDIYKSIMHICLYIDALDNKHYWGGDGYLLVIDILNSTKKQLNKELFKLKKTTSDFYEMQKSEVGLYMGIKKIPGIEKDKHKSAVFYFDEKKIDELLTELDNVHEDMYRKFEEFEYCIRRSAYSEKFDWSSYNQIKKHITDLIDLIKNAIQAQIIIDRKRYYRRNLENDKMAVIIPAYNAKKTIKRALYSIATQSILKHMKLNVYIVNDGSDYDYKEIVDIYKKYYNIYELKTKNNMGAGLARQYGIEHSKGEYIVFLDADDYFATVESLDTLYKEITQKKLDLVISELYKEKNGILEYNYKSMTYLHGEIFSREFIEKNQLCFSKTRYNEDVGFNLLTYLHSPKLSFISDITYIYTYNQESLTKINYKDYQYFGLKDLCYNIFWATSIAMKKNIDITKFSSDYLEYMILMYFAYCEYKDSTYDANKLLSWSKWIKDIYDKYCLKYLSNSEISQAIKKRNEIYAEYENKNIQMTIPYNEFLNMVERSNYDRYNNTGI